jgi:elongator complex protein 5
LTNGLNLNDSFNRLASAIIKLEPLKERTHFETQVALTGFIPQDIFSYTTITSNNITKGGIAHIEWRKKSGKVIYESNGFILNEKTQLLDVVPTSQLIGEEIKEEEDKEKELESEIKAMKIDPTANLSFNLSLTDEQRKQKENLVLPYLKAQQLEVSIDNEDNSGKKANNGGLIYYDPDAADDFDDEDPDEDLDI